MLLAHGLELNSSPSPSSSNQKYKQLIFTKYFRRLAYLKLGCSRMFQRKCLNLNSSISIINYFVALGFSLDCLIHFFFLITKKLLLSTETDLSKPHF